MNALRHLVPSWRVSGIHKEYAILIGTSEVGRKQSLARSCFRGLNSALALARISGGPAISHSRHRSVITLRSTTYRVPGHRQPRVFIPNQARVCSSLVAAAAAPTGDLK
jgi:hypothetical protein